MWVYDTTGLIRITFIAPAPPDVDSVDVIALIGKPCARPSNLPPGHCYGARDDFVLVHVQAHR
jgi:hypothetical protein